MGNWNISIRGVGAHHNAENPKDADRMARRFVRELREAGHFVLGAEITHGGAEKLLAVPDGEMTMNGEKLDDQGRDSTGLDRKGQAS